MEERERQQAEEKAKIDAEKERERQFIELLKQARSAAISPRAALPSRSDLALTRPHALTRPPPLLKKQKRAAEEAGKKVIHAAAMRWAARRRARRRAAATVVQAAARRGAAQGAAAARRAACKRLQHAARAVLARQWAQWEARERAKLTIAEVAISLDLARSSPSPQPALRLSSP